MAYIEKLSKNNLLNRTEQNRTTLLPIKSQRKTSIELLRIFTMMAVVALHYNNPIDASAYGRALFFVNKGSLNETSLYFIQSLCVVAVDLFILITGYFSCTSTKKSIQKPIRLIAQVIVLNLIYYFVQVVLDETAITLKHIIGQFLPCNYFVIIYSAVFLVSPFINLGLQKLSVRALNILVLVSFSLFSLEPTCCDILAKLTGNELVGLYTTSAFDGSGSGYTFVNFLLLYIIGAYLRLRTDESRFWFEKKQWLLGIVIFLNICLLTLWQYISPKTIQSVATEYCNPFVIINAALIFIFFNNINIKQSKIVNRIAVGSFTVFLTHSWFMHFFDIKLAVTQSLPILLFHILFTASICYMLGLIIHEVYSFITEPIYKLISCKLGFYVIKAEE